MVAIREMMRIVMEQEQDILIGEHKSGNALLPLTGTCANGRKSDCFKSQSCEQENKKAKETKNSKHQGNYVPRFLDLDFVH